MHRQEISRLRMLEAVVDFSWLYSGKRNHPFVLFDDAIEQLPVRSRDLGELVPPGIRSHRVVDRPAVGVISSLFLLRWHARVEWSAPAVIDDLDIGLRVYPSHHGPEDLFKVR